MQTPVSNPNPAVSSLAAVPVMAANPPVVPPTSLFVNDLGPTVTEQDLFLTFSKVGPVATVKVCCDSVTRRSLGYGYVNYHNYADAERALTGLNFTMINGSQCRIMWSQRDPTQRKSGVGNVFVKNLVKSIDNKTLYDMFSAYGNILSAKVPTDEKSQESKGYGFVQFDNAKSAHDAIAKINKTELPGFQGKTITVEPYKSKTDRGGNDKAHFTNVYVKNLPPSFTEEQLKDLFSKAGEVASVYLKLMDEVDKEPRCYGFVCYKDSDSAIKSIADFQNLVMEDKPLYVCRAMKKVERMHSLKANWEKLKEERFRAPPGSNLYVKNLAEEVTDEILGVDFGKYGAITSVKIMVEPNTKRSRGFGFVAFTTAEDASKALTHMNKMLYFSKPLIVCVAELKEIRRQRLAHQFDLMLKMPPNMYNQGNFGAMPFQNGAPMYQNIPYNRMQPNYAQDMYGGAPQQRQMQQQQMPRPNYPQQQQQQPQPYMQQLPGPQFTRAYNSSGGRGGRGGPAMIPQQMAQQMHPQQQQMQQQQMRNGQILGNRRGAPSGPNMAGRPQQQQPQQQQPQQPVGPQTDANPFESQKQQIGEQIFPLISAKHPELAGKITGMLLEMDLSELLQLCTSPALLDERIKEALEVLRSSGNLVA